MRFSSGRSDRERSIASIVLALFLVAGRATAGAAAPPEVVWEAGDDRSIPEPEEDEEGDYIWWDGTRNMTFYQAGRILDLGNSLYAVGEWVGLLGPREAANLNALDEVPSSTWFTNRHHLHPLSREALARGPNEGPPPSATGPLTIVSGKSLGQSPGFVARDGKGDRYLVKFDPPEVPEMATGAEMVASRILHALGWNVPEYHLFVFDPRRLEIDPEATTEDEYNRKQPMTRADLGRILERAARLPNGHIRSIASRQIRGTPKGPFSTQGVRPDDPNDRIRHDDRRDLRGLRIVAAWIHYTDARRGNFYDTFVKRRDDPEGRGHLVHYLLDFSSSLGSGNVEWKDPKDGNEYFVDPPAILRSFVSLGLWVKPWEDPPPVAHRAIGYFDGEIFDPERWRTTYPNPLFDRLTTRDEFWGAKLVASFTDEDVRTVVDSGGWSDRAAADALSRALRERRDRIARVYFRTDRINPIYRFVVERGRLRFEDLAVRTRIVSREEARYRYRAADGPWTETHEPEVPLASEEATVVEIATRHGPAADWSPVTRLSLALREDGRLQVVGVERQTSR